MKRIFTFICIGALLVHLNTKAQDVSKIVGTYEIHEVRSSYMDPEIVETLDYVINIKPSSIDSFDIQYYLPTFILDTVRATLLNDSVFEFRQLFYAYYSTDTIISSIYGEGIIHNDSITINHDLSEEYISVFGGYCNGFKINTAINSKNTIESNLMIYPNPVSDILYFDIKNSYNFSNNLIAQIYNANSALVQQTAIENQNTSSINVSKLKAGVYFIEILKDDKTEYSGKFIKK